MTGGSMWDRTGARYRPTPFEALDPKARFHGTDHSVTVSEFWRWGFSDLRDNALRGILAEYLVAKALDIPVGVRQSWDPYDLRMEDGTTIEVKSSGYLQSWAQVNHSKTVFGGLKARNWSSEHGYSTNMEYRADIFIFGVQIAEEHEDYDRLDVNQWQWWVAPRQAVAGRNSRTLTIGSVRKIADGPVAFDALSMAVGRVLGGSTVE